MNFRLTGRVGVLAAAVLLVACYALHVAWLGLRWGNDAQAPLLSSLLYTGCSVAAALTALGAAFRQRGRSRGGWLLIGLALTADAAVLVITHDPAVMVTWMVSARGDVA